MGLTDQIKDSIRSKLVVRYRTGEVRNPQVLSCVICGRDFTLNETLCLYIKEEGYICRPCSERFAPEMVKTMDEYQGRDIRKIIRKGSSCSTLSSAEWKDVSENLAALSENLTEIAKGVSRGIVEAPAGCIGLLHYAKDIPVPPRYQDESDLDFQIRSKSYREKKIFEKITNETSGRLQTLAQYLIKLGMPVSRKGNG